MESLSMETRWELLIYIKEYIYVVSDTVTEVEFLFIGVMP